MGPKFTPGQLNQRITVQRRSDQPDGFGNVKGGWVTVGSGIPAGISPMKGGEAVRAQRLEAVRNYEIVTRSCGMTRTLKSSDRLTNQRTGETYNIRHIANLDERDRWLIFTVVAD